MRVFKCLGGFRVFHSCIKKQLGEPGDNEEVAYGSLNNANQVGYIKNRKSSIDHITSILDDKDTFIDYEECSDIVAYRMQNLINDKPTNKLDIMTNKSSFAVYDNIVTNENNDIKTSLYVEPKSTVQNESESGFTNNADKLSTTFSLNNFDTNNNDNLKYQVQMDTCNEKLNQIDENLNINEQENTISDESSSCNIDVTLDNSQNNIDQCVNKNSVIENINYNFDEDNKQNPDLTHKLLNNTLHENIKNLDKSEESLNSIKTSNESLSYSQNNSLLLASNDDEDNKKYLKGNKSILISSKGFEIINKMFQYEIDLKVSKLSNCYIHFADLVLYHHKKIYNANNIFNNKNLLMNDKNSILNLFIKKRDDILTKVFENLDDCILFMKDYKDNSDIIQEILNNMCERIQLCSKNNHYNYSQYNYNPVYIRTAAELATARNDKKILKTRFMISKVIDSPYVYYNKFIEDNIEYIKNNSENMIFYIQNEMLQINLTDNNKLTNIIGIDFDKLKAVINSSTLFNISTIGAMRLWSAKIINIIKECYMDNSINLYNIKSLESKIDVSMITSKFNLENHTFISSKGYIVYLELIDDFINKIIMSMGELDECYNKRLKCIIKNPGGFDFLMCYDYIFRE